MVVKINHFFSPQNHLKIRNSRDLNYFSQKIYQIKGNFLRIVTRTQLHMFRRWLNDEIL